MRKYKKDIHLRKDSGTSDSPGRHVCDDACAHAVAAVDSDSGVVLVVLAEVLPQQPDLAPLNWGHRYPSAFRVRLLLYFRQSH